MAERESAATRYSRPEARRRIERVFNAAVMEVFGQIELADLRAVVLNGEADQVPAIAIVCDSVGQIDLGWIEKSNVLRDVLTSHVAPVSWRASAYKVLGELLGAVLPVFGFETLFDEISMYYWDGETEDEAARKVLVEFHGHDEAELTLPSHLNARRPDFMLAENAAPLKDLPGELATRIRRLRAAHQAVRALADEGNAWHFEPDLIHEYVDDYANRALLPPLTIVPFDHFAQEIDEVAHHGMDYGFVDIAGLCPLPDASTIDTWFASLRTGAELLVAAQALIDFDPARR